MKDRKKKRMRYMRSNMDVSLALVRCACALALFIFLSSALSVFGAYAAMPGWASLLAQTALTLACFLLPAYRGLFVVDGNQSQKLCRRAIAPGQLLYLAGAGVLLVCPMTLLHDLIMAPFVRMGAVQTAGAAPDFALFLPLLIKSAVLVPVCEELFFRGYLSAVLREAGVRWGDVFSAALFALVHGVDAALLPRFAMGLLLGLLMRRTDSLLAPIIVHAAYNASLLLLSGFGLDALFGGIGFVSALVRIVGSAAFLFLLGKIWTARRAAQMLSWGRRLTLRQILTLSLSLAVLAYLPVVLLAIG